MEKTDVSKSLVFKLVFDGTARFLADRAAAICTLVHDLGYTLEEATEIVDEVINGIGDRSQCAVDSIMQKIVAR